MPTLYWLVDRDLHDAVSRLESDGGVHRFEDLVDEQELRRTHDRYELRRRNATVRLEGAQPTGGVGGTRVGIKCLHAHLANYLVDGNDPVGELVAGAIEVPLLTLEDVRD